MSGSFDFTLRLAALGVAQDDRGWHGGKSRVNHLICPAAKVPLLLDTRWSNEEDDQCDREWRDAPERD
jgi:hypothetical protein